MNQIWTYTHTIELTQLFGLLLSILVSLGLLQSLFKARTKKCFDTKVAHSNECQQPKMLHYSWPFAIDLVLQAFSADRAGTILTFFRHQFERTANTFEQVILGDHGISTQDPENIKAILSTQFHEFGLSVRSESFRPLLGNGIFTQDGEAWKVSRDLLRPQFLQTRTKSFGYMQTEVEKFIYALKQSHEQDLDLQPLFFRLTLDTSMAVLFGKPAKKSMIKGKIDESDFAKAFDHAQHGIASRAHLGNWYWLLGGRAFKRSCQTVHDFVDGIVAETLQETESGTKDNSTDRYVFLRELIKRTRDPLTLRDQLLNVLLAARDTTACLLSWTINILAAHQDIQSELRNECLNLESYKGNGLPTTAEVKGMKYLSIVLKEVLRIYPSVPCNTRFALKTTTLPVGGGPDGKSPIIVKKGMGVGYSPYVMHRRKDIFGEDADAFRPSRWDENSEQGQALKGIGFAYIPFNKGPRVCPGQEFALLETSYSVVRLLQTFSQIKRYGEPPKSEKHNVTIVLSNADGCKVALNRSEH